VKKSQTAISEVIREHDIELIKFDSDSGNAVLCDVLRTGITTLASNYFLAANKLLNQQNVVEEKSG